MADHLSLILQAACFAAERHRSQLRKGAESTPYINHPLEVARILIDEGGVSDPEVIAAALLHDTIEDTETTGEELLALFGERVTGLVQEVTDDKALPKETRKQLQIFHAPHKSSGAALVKLADKIANVRDIVERPPAHWALGRRVEYLGWARRVVEGLPAANPALQACFEREFRRALERLCAEG
jgi:guanosine-3',5'-bis(diphosphate) 3'-pyrophosphohydrolase